MNAYELYQLFLKNKKYFSKILFFRDSPNLPVNTNDAQAIYETINENKNLFGKLLYFRPDRALKGIKGDKGDKGDSGGIFVGLTKITVSASEPVDPSLNDLWIDIS